MIPSWPSAAAGLLGEGHPGLRLGATSFVYPGTWSYNVERLGPHFDDIELLCFEQDHLPAAPELTRLRELSQRYGLSYCVHTPLEPSLASHDTRRRRRGVAAVAHCMQHMAGLEPSAYVLHVYLGDSEGDERFDGDVAGFQARAASSLRELAQLPVGGARLCGETLDYDPALIAPVVSGLDLCWALDLGHVLRDGGDPAVHLDRYLHRTALIQLHGTDPRDRDHRGLGHVPAALGRALLQRLRLARFSGVLTLEVFREADLQQSRAALRSWARGAEPV